MPGMLAAALGGAVMGLGQGIAENAKNDMARSNMELKSELDEKRDRLIAQLTSERDTRQNEFQAGESGKGREFQASENAQSRGQQAQQHTESMALGYSQQSEAARHNKAAEANAAASLQVQRELAKNRMQVSDDGTLLQLSNDKEGKPVATPVTNADGEPVKVSKNLNEADAKKITTLTKLIDQQEANLAKAVLPAQQQDVKQRLSALYEQLSEVSGIKSPMAAAKPTNRPGLGSFMK